MDDPSCEGLDHLDDPPLVLLEVFGVSMPFFEIWMVFFYNFLRRSFSMIFKGFSRFFSSRTLLLDGVEWLTLSARAY